MPLDPRLETDLNLWLATTRPDGRPHLVPIWFVWLDGEIYILTSLQSVKARNLLANPRASIALENGSTPLIAECAARLVPPPFSEALAAAFLRKYEWDVHNAGEYDGMFALSPQRWLSWNA
jgi:hypothetical protein